jgi:hypothetical protein
MGKKKESIVLEVQSLRHVIRVDTTPPKEKDKKNG